MLMHSLNNITGCTNISRNNLFLTTISKACYLFRSGLEVVEKLSFMAKQQKATTKIFSVNLQEGFVIDAQANTIYAAYHHLHETIITITPWSQYDFEIPSELRHYKVINKLVPVFSLTGWTSKGYVSSATLARPKAEKTHL